VDEYTHLVVLLTMMKDVKLDLSQSGLSRTREQ